MSANIERFRTSYAAAFRSYALAPSEAALRTAYELGRNAVGQGLSMLDLAVVHHDALLLALRRASGVDEAVQLTRLGGEFFLEAISAFEMVQRGFREARDSALLERRHAMMLRQLSNLLADASLALDASDSLQEMLQLVAEQARELIGADHCLATVTLAGHRHSIKAISSSATDAGATAFVASHSRPELLPGGRLATPLTALDGRELGSIQLFGRHEGEFTEVDEAVLVNLAQMAAAAVERAWLYQQASYAPKG
ncbi:MAG: hypothetical protein H0U03_08145 [Actinobacteria bacterium]|nr:hypothetical protein [Actinomycetota bacterium]